MTHAGQQVPERLPVARHFQAHIETLGHVQLGLYVGYRFPGDIHGTGGAESGRQRQAFRVDIGDDHVARTRMPADCRRHGADGACAGDEDVFSQQVPLQRGMHGIAQRVEQGGHIQVDPRSVLPHIGHGQGNVFGEGAGAVHADPTRVVTQMASPRHAVAAAATDQMTLPGDDLPRAPVVHVLTDFDDLTDKLVPHHHGHRNGLLRPGVPVVDMHVGAADGRPFHLHQHIIDTGIRIGHILQPYSRLGILFYQCFHIVIRSFSILCDVLGQYPSRKLATCYRIRINSLPARARLTIISL